MKPVLGITMGDPAGVGPEILLRATPKLLRQKKISFVIFGDYSYLERTHKYFRKKMKSRRFLFDPVSSLDFVRDPKKIPVFDSGLLKKRPLTFGRVTKWGGEASGLFVNQAVEAALKHKIQGIVTLPINKQSFALSRWGKKYRDHTSMLAALTRTKSVALMLASGPLRAVHVTQHIPLKQVSQFVTTNRILETIRLAHEALIKMGIKSPKMAVCGLNPHAGDGGVLGSEEKKVIIPAIKKIRRQGWKVEGPISPDVVWPMVLSGKYDAGVAMYHDQGQIPVKMQGQGIVNVTLGLPFVRTSVGHGTAFEIAGKGRASTKSFLEAVKTSVSMLKIR